MYISIMKKTIILLLIAFGMKAQKIDDKTKHYLAGVIISNWAGSTSYYFGLKPFKSCSIGFAVAGLVGIAKEAIWDKRLHRGTCDNQDAYTTIWGGLAGAMCLRIGIDRNQKKYPEKIAYFNN